MLVLLSTQSKSLDLSQKWSSGKHRQFALKYFEIHTSAQQNANHRIKLNTRIRTSILGPKMGFTKLLNLRPEQEREYKAGKDNDSR